MAVILAYCIFNLPPVVPSASTSSRAWTARSEWISGRHLRWRRDGRAVLRRVAALAGKEVARSISFLDVRSGEELLSCIKRNTDNGRFPPNIASGMEGLYTNYRDAILQSGIPMAENVILSNMSTLLDRILLDLEDPFIFPAYHKAIREPFDYFLLGQKYIRPLIDFRRSYVGNIEIFQEIEDGLQKGHNIVLVSNHQTEADPAVIALLLDTTNPRIATEMTYVAGDRVITDPLCKPFSMGRNLLCVYSKKHLYDDPGLVEMKKMSNTRSLKEMALLFRKGEQILWIAPSGGRDRPDSMTGECFPALFDASSVDNIRRLAEHCGVPVHFYPLALLCYDIMPPPVQVEKIIGERRDVSFHGVGLSIGHEVLFNEVVAGLDSPGEIKSAFSQTLYDLVNEQYKVLRSAIYDDRGLEASNDKVSLSQTWK